jgi:hypothetical protein
MSNVGNRGSDQVPDLTIDPNDPEPQYADIDNPTDAECLAHIEWVKRNFEAMYHRGVECPFDDED